MTQILKPCPFCGKPPGVDNYGPGACARIYCESDGCPAYPYVRRYANGDAMEKASAAWNTRHSDPDELRVALDDLQQAEFEYRLMHDRHGDGATPTGRAWDLMKRAGEKARTALSRNVGDVG